MEVTRKPGVRYREARFLPDGKALLALSDESGEVEFWTFPANGVGKPRAAHPDGKVLRWEGVPSPDGKCIAHHDKNQQLWLLDVEAASSSRSPTSTTTASFDGPRLVARQPLARLRRRPARNSFSGSSSTTSTTGTITPVTTDRYDSYSPAWSRDGKWLYFLSDRNLRDSSSVALGTAPAGAVLRQADEGLRRRADARACARRSSPPTSCTRRARPTRTDGPRTTGRQGRSKDDDKPRTPAKPPQVEIDLDGIAARLYEVPVPPGNYSDLAATARRLFWLSARPGSRGQAALKTAGHRRREAGA